MYYMTIELPQKNVTNTISSERIMSQHGSPLLEFKKLCVHPHFSDYNKINFIIISARTPFIWLCAVVGRWSSLTRTVYGLKLSAACLPYRPWWNCGTRCVGHLHRLQAALTRVKPIYSIRLSLNSMSNTTSQIEPYMHTHTYISQ